MAATGLFRRAPPAPAWALPQTPALLRDGTTPGTVAGGTKAGISSPGGHRCHRTPGQVKGAFGVAREGRKRPPLPRPGNRRHHQQLPDEEMPTPPQGNPRGSSRRKGEHAPPR